MKNIPYGKQHITEDDIQSVVDVLRSDFLTQGPLVQEFEEAFAKYIGSKYAVAVANGTAALHLCALALEVSDTDKVITTPITFAASANCIQYCGGEVIFSDIDSQSYLLDIEAVTSLLKASPAGTYKGIIPVDFAGMAINMEALKKIADEYGLWIIEDACHAPGGYFIDSSGKKQNCGNGIFADLAIFSFHPVKHITTGEGGMITTNNQELYKKLLTLRTHGIIRDTQKFKNDFGFAIGNKNITNEQTGLARIWPAWYMEMQTLGYNYRLTDFQSALGLSQLKRADLGLIKRKNIAQKYSNAFEGKQYIKGKSGIVEGHAYHLYIIEVEKKRYELYNYLRTNNIFAQIHYIPCHLMPYYRQLEWEEGDMPHAEKYYSQCLSLPMYPTLTEAEQTFVIDTIDEFYNG